jgi:hypothetical protein
MRFSYVAKTHPLGFRVEQWIKEGIGKAAEADGRSVSSFIERILAAWLDDHGFGNSAPSESQPTVQKNRSLPTKRKSAER